MTDKGMPRNDFLNAILDDGVHEIETNYLRPEQLLKREGGIAGFEACRGKSDQEILALWEEAKLSTGSSRDKDDPRYWWYRMYDSQIEWVLNVLSAALYNQNFPVLINPTGRGMMKAADILGVKR